MNVVKKCVQIIEPSTTFSDVDHCLSDSASALDDSLINDLGPRASLTGSRKRMFGKTPFIGSSFDAAAVNENTKKLEERISQLECEVVDA